MLGRSDTSGFRVLLLAFAFVGGEVCGFCSDFMSAMWPWACCVSVLLALAWIGWGAQHLRWLLSVSAGITLAWRCEAQRIGIESGSKSVCRAGEPPAYELRVESDVTSRMRGDPRVKIVCFRSSVGGMPVRVVARMGADDAVPAPDETWLCKGWLSLKKDSPTRFSSRTLWVMERDHIWKISGASGFSAKTAYRDASGFLASYADVGLGWSEDLAETNMAMLLGRKGGLSEEQRNAFAAAGTMHVFAISGLHVMLVAALLGMALSRLGFNAIEQAAVAIPLLAGYVMLTGARPSAVRAALMMSIWLASKMFGRKPEPFVALGVSAILVYGISPQMVFSAGCALSFAVMLGILLWIRWSSKFAMPLGSLFALAEEEASLGVEGLKGKVLCCCRGWVGWILGMFGVSLAAWIASTPVSAIVFGRISFGGLFANVVVVPLVTMSVMFSLIGIGAAFISNPAGALFNNLAACCTWMMEKVSGAVAGCGWASVETLPWSWLDCVVWYGAWIGLFAVLSRNLKRRDSLDLMPVHHWRKER